MNMYQWKDALIAAPRKKAIPVLTFPAIQLMGISVKELISDSETQAKGMEIIAGRCDSGAALSMMDLSVEAEAFGSSVRVAGDEVPTVVGSIVNEPEDADALKIPQLGAGRTGLYIEGVAKAAARITDRPLLAGAIGPFSLAGRLIGMTEIMMDCYDEPEMVHAVLEKATSFLITYIEGFKAAGADGVLVAEPAVGLLSPQMAAEFATPYMKRITEAVQTAQFGLFYHNCGNGTRLMTDELAAIGALGYHFGDGVNMTEICAKMPGDVLVMGNISPARTFRAGTPEQVREETLALMDACCAKYPNFVISSGCDIPPMTPWENIDAFFAAVEEFYAQRA